MTSLSAVDSRNILRDINSCSDIASCVYCGNYSTGLKVNRRDQVVCSNFEDCVYNRLESGAIDEARAVKLLGHPLACPECGRVYGQGPAGACYYCGR